MDDDGCSDDAHCAEELYVQPAEDAMSAVFEEAVDGWLEEDEIDD